MTESDTLHTRCRDEIDRRLRAATDASSKLTGWINWPGGSQRQIGLCFDDQDDPAAIVYLALVQLSNQATSSSPLSRTRQVPPTESPFKMMASSASTVMINWSGAAFSA